MFVNIAGLAVILAYALAFALLESLLWLALILIPTLVFKRLRENFFSYAGITATVLLIWSVALRTSVLAYELTRLTPIMTSVAVAAALTFLFLILASRLTKWIRFLADQLSVFVFIYVPLGVICLLIVAVRLSV
jgi:hypothetical protein